MKQMMSKLKKKMPMPEDKLPPEESEQVEEQEEESPEFEAGEEEAEDEYMSADEFEAPAEPSQLEGIPDEELIAEMKKRGIMSELDQPAEEPAPAPEKKKFNPFAK